MNPEIMIPLAMSVLAFVTVMGIALPFLQRDALDARLKVITDRRRELGNQARERMVKRPSWRQPQTGRVGFMKMVLERLNLKKLAEQPELRKKLIRAGLRGQGPLITFTFMRFALPIGFAGFTAFILFVSKNIEMSAAMKLLIVAGAGGFGYLLPNIMVSNKIAKRQKDIQRAFPDALDLMVICVESGLSMEAAFGRVSEEMAEGAPTLAEEFGITTAELAYLSDRQTALENLSERTGMPTMKSFVMALVQSAKYGTPVGVSLRVVADENRDMRMSAAEEKAAGLPAKLTVPMVLCFLPVLFMVLIGPMVIQAIKQFSGG
ncbi:MAG: type II secretion system F family protein [Pseudomonadota bacterium]